MGRNIGAVVVGLLVVFFVVIVLQSGISWIYPLPEGLDPLDPADAEALASHLESQPPTAWLLALASEIIGVFLGAWAAGSVASTRKPMFAGFIVALGLVGSILNWMAFSHPPWFIAGQLVAYPLVFLAVHRMLPRAPSFASSATP